MGQSHGTEYIPLNSGCVRKNASTGLRVEAGWEDKCKTYLTVKSSHLKLDVGCFSTKVSLDVSGDFIVKIVVDKIQLDNTTATLERNSDAFIVAKAVSYTKEPLVFNMERDLIDSKGYSLTIESYGQFEPHIYIKSIKVPAPDVHMLKAD